MLTANGNTAYVNWEKSNIVIFADSNGDNARFFNLIDEGCNHGAWVEIDDGEDWREPTGEEWAAFEKSLGC